MNPYFDGFILFVIILNTVCQALDQYPDLDSYYLHLLQLANHIFTVIFTVEVIFKMIGLGVRCFFQEKFNQFDLVIVIISLLEMEMVN
jgi:fumarate reductase subunit C